MENSKVLNNNRDFIRFAVNRNSLGPKARIILSDIRFWIMIFFIIRLFGITNPPLEIAHNWRQALTNMIARNFLEEDSNILFPRMDMRGAGSGIIGSEFPLFNYLIFLFSKLFGYAHWYGRLINLVVSSAGVYFFYAILKRFVNERAAFASAFILLCSVWFVYSRKSMPDTFSVSLTIAGIYFGIKYLYENKWMHLLMSIVLSTLGVLSKIPALFLLSVFALMFFDKRITIHVKGRFVSAFLLIIATVSAWYFYWVPSLIDHYYNPLYFPKQLGEGFRELIARASETADKFYFSSLRSYTAFIVFVTGLFFMIRRKQKFLLITVMSATAVFFFFMMKAGDVFSLHGYYIIPYTPVMALCAGFALGEIKSQKWFAVLLLIIATEAITNQQHDFHIKETEKYKLRLEYIADQVCDRNTLIGINGGQNPQQIYFTRRKGWTFDDEKLNNKKFLDSLKNNGCKFIFINKVTTTNHQELAGENVYEDDSYKVIRLDH